jgi:hypothetical protein
MKESDMLNAWLWDKHRQDLQWRRVRLGVMPSKEMARMYMTMLRWADAVIVSDGIVYIVEAKLRPDPGAIGQLELYRELFANTLEFSQYKNYPLRLILLCSMADLAVAELCSKKDIIFEVFSQDEVNRVRKGQMKFIV